MINSFEAGGDWFGHILIFILNLRQLVVAQNSERWKPAGRYSFGCTECPYTINIIDINNQMKKNKVSSGVWKKIKYY